MHRWRTRRGNNRSTLIKIVGEQTMARKKQQQQRNSNEFDLPKEKAATLADQLGGDVLAKLKAAKQEMVADEKAKEEERIAQATFERKQREKNMSFEELLNQFGDKGSKF